MRNIVEKIPAFKLSLWLLRLPLSIVFIQQGLSKFPVILEDAQGYDLSYLTWWVVAHGELGSGLGLILGGVFLFGNSFLSAVGDLVTRFSGFTIGEFNHLRRYINPYHINTLGSYRDTDSTSAST